MSAYINYLGTANPPYQINQQQIGAFMASTQQMDAEEEHQLKVLYRASGISTRYSVLADYQTIDHKAYTFYPPAADIEPFPSVGQRMKIYEREAIKLSLAAVQDTLPADFNLSSITHLVTVSCTGMYAPGIDIELIEQLELSTSIQRTAINFMGCYAAFNALKTANQIVIAQPDANVLVVAVELCSLHFQKKKDPDSLLANALFADGAAAVLVSGRAKVGSINLSMESFFCDLAFQGKQDMAWSINDFGFEMRLTAMVPDFIRGGIRQLTNNLLKSINMDLEQVNYFAIHPGGKRILRVIEQELGLERYCNRFAYQVLREYGNMSSPTILFVLKALLAEVTTEDKGKNVLSFAFGPGLTLESMLLKVC
jgi:predicted naringenin-chalcone synthase